MKYQNQNPIRFFLFQKSLELCLRSECLATVKREKGKKKRDLTDRSFFNLSLRIRFLFVSVNFVQVAKLNKFCIIFILLIIWFCSGCEGFRFCEFRWFGRWIDWIKPEKKNNEELWTDSEFGFSRYAFFFPFCFVVTWSRSWLTVLRFSGLKRKKWIC